MPRRNTPQGSRWRQLRRALGVDGAGGLSRPRAAEGSLAAQLEGRTFLSSAVTGHDLVRGTTIHLEFASDQQLQVYAGCNHISGTLRYDGSRLTVDDVGKTEMGCDRPLVDQDAWICNLLRAGVDADLVGDSLILTGERVSLRLIDRRVADPDQPVEGITWALEGILTGNGPAAALSSVPEGIAATLRIENGRIHFFDGRREYTGTATVTSDSVHVLPQMTSSPSGSTAPVAESMDMSALMRDFSYQVTARQLIITGAGDAGLMFVANDDAPAEDEVTS